MKKYVKEILKSIAEGHDADLAFRAEMFAHRVPRAKWAQVLTDTVAALDKQINEYSWSDGEEEQAGQRLLELQAQRSVLEAKLTSLSA
jgi:hypothetical protein